MISLKKLRKSPSTFERLLSLKGDNTSLESILSLDEKIRKLKTKSNEIRSKRNASSDLIGRLKKEKKDVKEIIMETRILGDKLKEVDNKLNSLLVDLNKLLLQIPNLPDSSVPSGKNEINNVEIRKWGKKPKFNFTPKTHLEINKKVQFVDFRRGSKISGNGFPYYVGKGALLERNLINAMINHHVSKYTCREILPSVLMNRQAMITTGQLPKFQDDMYHTELDNLYLAPTAEVPITNLHANEILDESTMPLNYVAYSPCFRRESGSYGKETRGLLRVHQFNKVELVKFTTPENSSDELENITMQAESILKILGLHYRVVELCSGDLSFSAAKCYDIEIWAPGERVWLEVSSCSNFRSFQARRGKIRYRKILDGKVDYVHTLNGSGLATPRLVIALLETYQKEDGSVSFPEDVSDFLGIKEI